jgi:hypothetical protein
MPSRRQLARKQPRRAPASERSDSSVFLNIPYDHRFENLYLAYIAGISAFGLVPRAAIEIPAGSRLDHIFGLIASCRYSIHDLSPVMVANSKSRIPRFNMAFELGLAVACERTWNRRYDWFVCEAQADRLQKSLTDMNGTDPYLHRGTITGLFGRLCNAFVRSGRQPTVPQMKSIYLILRRKLPGLMRDSGASSVFEARVFQGLCLFASAAADEAVL